MKKWMFKTVSLIVLLFLASSSFAQGWVSVPSGVNETLNDVSFPSVAHESVAWVAGDNGTILHSSNGGNVWSVQTSNNANHFYDIDFIDANNGTATGAGGTILQTSNGGSTWTVIQTDYWMSYYGCSQLTTTQTFIAGQNTIFQPIVTWTGDAWNSQDSGVFYIVLEGVNNEGSASAITALNSDTLVVAATVWDNTGAIARSTNGGSTWSTVSSNPSAQRGIDFNHVGTGISVGYGGTILRSTDYGATWNVIGSPVGADLHDVAFADESTVFAVGDAGTIIKSIDGGLSWEQQEAITASALYGVAFEDANTGLAVGELGTILRTETGGDAGNEPPSSFEWLAPEADALLDRTDPVVFQWNRSNDPDDDNVTYILDITREFDGEVTHEEVVDTVDVLDLNSGSLPDTSVHFTWTVSATDGQDTVAASNGSGSFTFLPVNSVPAPDTDQPEGFSLSAAYPNPFNSMTIIRYHVEQTTEVKLTVYNLLGEVVTVLKDGQVTAGSHLAAWRGEDTRKQKVSSGTYIVRMEANDQQTSLRVTFVK